MTRRDSHAERVGDVLANSLKRLELGSQLDEYGVWPVWNEVVGEPVARNAQPEKIRNGTLFVKVSSPVWMQQLQYMKEMIAESVNQRLKADVVKNIFFVVGRVDNGTVEVKETERPTKIRAGVERRVDNEFLNSVADPEMREAFKKLLRSYERRKQKA